MSVSYRLKRKFAQGQYQAYSIKLMNTNGKVKSFVEAVVACGKSFLRFILSFFKFSYWQNWIIEDGGVVAYNFGRFAGFIGFQPKIIQVLTNNYQET